MQLYQSPTLYLGLLNASKMMNRSVSHCRVGILKSAGGERAYFYHRPSCNALNPATEQIGLFGLTTLLDMVRVFVDPQWQPREIGLVMNHPPHCSIDEQFPNTRIRLSQPCVYVALEDELLSLPPNSGEAATPASSPLDHEPLEKNLVGSLEQVLRSYIQGHKLSVEFAAALSNRTHAVCNANCWKSASFRSKSRAYQKSVRSRNSRRTVLTQYCFRLGSTLDLKLRFILALAPFRFLGAHMYAGQPSNFQPQGISSADSAALTTRKT